MTSLDVEVRRSIVAACGAMNASGLNQGTSGNICVRAGDDMLITPSAIPYDVMTPDMIVRMALDGGDAPTVAGPWQPSSEWRFHRAILKARSEFGAIVHAHSTFATTLAIARKPIPACHYMVAAFGGTDVKVSGYATYGTAELASTAVAALEGRNACLLANHGMIACGPNLERAMWLAVELETLAKHYFYALLIGGPVLLSDAEVADAARSFSSYGAHGKPPKTA